MLQSAAMNDQSHHPETVQGLALLLWSADSDTPQRLATPFAHAAVAAAMDLRVEIYFSARSVELLVPGVAAALRPSPGQPGSVLDLMREAVAQGAVLLACSEALAAQGINPQGLITECQGRGGSVQFIARTADPRWRSLVF
jgi:uncharacterized protein